MADSNEKLEVRENSGGEQEQEQLIDDVLRSSLDNSAEDKSTRFENLTKKDEQNSKPELNTLNSAITDRLKNHPPVDAVMDYLNASTARERQQIVKQLAIVAFSSGNAKPDFHSLKPGEEIMAAGVRQDIHLLKQGDERKPADIKPDIYRDGQQNREKDSRPDIFKANGGSNFDIRRFENLSPILQDISYYDACSKVKEGLLSGGIAGDRATFDGLRRLAELEFGSGRAAKDATTLLNQLSDNGSAEFKDKIKVAREHKGVERQMLAETIESKLKAIAEGNSNKSDLACLEQANIRAILQGSSEIDFFARLGRAKTSLPSSGSEQGYMAALNKLNEQGDKTAKDVLRELVNSGNATLDKERGKYLESRGPISASHILELANFAKPHQPSDAQSDDATVRGYDQKGPTPLDKLAEMAGINLAPEQLKKLLTDAVEKQGEKAVRDGLARCLAFNSLTAQQRLELSASTENLKEGQFLRLDDKPINALTFSALPRELRQQLLGTDKMPAFLKEVPNVADWKISANEFNALPAHSRRDITGSTEKVNASFDLSKVETLSAESIKRSSPELRRFLTGDAAFKGQSLSAADFKLKELTAEQFNKLTNDDRKMLTGRESSLEAGMSLSLAGKTAFWDGPGSPNFTNETRHRLIGAIGRATDKNYPTFTDLSRLSIDAKTYNALPPAIRAKLNCTDERLDPTLVLRQMAAGTISEADSSAKFLFGKAPLEERISQMQASASESLETLRDSKSRLMDAMNGGLKDLQKSANSSLGFVGRVLSWTGVTDGEQAHRTNQNLSLNSVANFKGELLNTTNQERQVQLNCDALGLAMKNFQHAQALSQGDLRKADLIAASAYSKYGESLKYLSPHLYHVISPDSAQGAWKRLNGDSIASQSLALRNPEQVRNLSGGGLKEGLKLLSNLNDAANQADASVLRSMALKAVDSDPAVQKLSRVAAQLNENLSVMAIGAQSTGTKWESFVATVKASGRQVEESLRKLTADELSAVRAQRDVIAESLRREGEGSISDPDSRKALKARLDAINSSLSLLDPKEIAKDKADIQKSFDERNTAINKEVNILEQRIQALGRAPEKLGGDNSREAEKLSKKVEELKKEQSSLSNLSKREQLAKLLEEIKKPEFEADTAENWFKREGFVTAAGIVAATAALAVIEVGSFGAATPLVVAVVGTGGFMVGAEAAKETQYIFGVRSDGALAGNWGRQVLDSHALAEGRYREWIGESASNFKDNVALPYATELAIGTAMFYFSGKLGQTAMDKAFANQAKQLAMLAAESPAKLGFTEALLNGLKSQLTTPLQMGLEQNARDVFGNSQETSMAISFVVSTLLSAGHRGIQLRAANASGRAISAEEISKLSIAGKNGDDAAGNLKLAYQPENAQSEAAYIRDLEKQGFKISSTDSGFKMSRDGFTAELVRVDASKKVSLAKESDNANPNPMQRPLDKQFSENIKPLGLFEKAKAFFFENKVEQQVVQEIRARVKEEAIAMGIPKDAADALAVQLMSMPGGTGAMFDGWSVNFSRKTDGEKAVTQLTTHEVRHAADAFINTVLHRANPELFTNVLVNQLSNSIGAGGHVSSAAVGYQHRMRLNVDATPTELAAVRDVFRARLAGSKSLKDLDARFDKMQREGWASLNDQFAKEIQAQYSKLAEGAKLLGKDLPPLSEQRLAYLAEQVKISLLHADDVCANVTINSRVVEANPKLAGAIQETAQKMQAKLNEQTNPDQTKTANAAADKLQKYLEHKLEGISFSISGRSSEVSNAQSILQDANYNSSPEEMHSFRAQEADNLNLLCKAYDVLSTASKMANNPEVSSLYKRLQDTKPHSPEANSIMLELISRVPTDKAGIKDLVRAEKNAGSLIKDAHLESLIKQIDQSKAIIEHLNAKEQMVRSLVRYSASTKPEDMAYHQKIMSDAARKAVETASENQIPYLKNFIEATGALSPCQLNAALQQRSLGLSEAGSSKEWRAGRQTNEKSGYSDEQLAEIISRSRAWDKNRKERVAKSEDQGSN